MGRRAHKPDPAQRKQVEAMAAYGIPEADVARVVGIDPKTLRKCYREELDLGETKANAQVAGFLFNSARTGNVTAQEDAGGLEGGPPRAPAHRRVRHRRSPRDVGRGAGADRVRKALGISRHVAARTAGGPGPGPEGHGGGFEGRSST